MNAIPAAPADYSGETIGEYTLVERLGSGGFGQVYSARRMDEEIPNYALKLYPQLGREDDNIRDRIAREFHVSRGLRHPNLARVIERATSERHGEVLVMELVRGDTLETVLDERSRLSLGEAASIVHSVANGLDLMHKSGTLHRDIKPANIILRPPQVERANEGLTGRTAVIVDFGSAKPLNNLETSITARPNERAPVTYRYASPEQCEEQALTAASDIFSLGLVAVEMICGEIPYVSQESVFQIVASRLRDRPRRLLEIDPNVAWPPGLQRVVDRALAPSPADRFEAAGELASAIVGVSQAFTIGAQ